MSVVEGALISIAIMIYMSIGFLMLFKQVENKSVEWKLLDVRGRAAATLIMLFLWLPVMLFLTIWQLITGKD